MENCKYKKISGQCKNKEKTNGYCTRHYNKRRCSEWYRHPRGFKSLVHCPIIVSGDADKCEVHH